MANQKNQKNKEDMLNDISAVLNLSQRDLERYERVKDQID
jgi:hypothetical protein